MIIFFSCLDYITFKNLDLEYVQNRFFLFIVQQCLNNKN